MEKTLTIVIPTYNMEKYLRTCLDSLIVGEGQEQLEVLVINDGSKDASSAIAHEYEAKHPESFRVIDKENGNYGSCINRGLKEATGKYIKILDADDYFDTPSLKTFLQKLHDINTDLVLTDYVIFGDNNYNKKRYGFNLPVNNELNFTDICGQTSFCMDIQMHHVTYRTALFLGFDYHQAEGISYTDTEWIFAPMSKVRRIVYLNLPLYQYLVGREGQTIALTQQKKSASHYLLLANSMINDYALADKTKKPIKSYLDFRMERLMKYIYRLFLAEWPGMELNGLADIDRRLKDEMPTLYEATGRRTMGPFIRIKYVSYWRRHNYAPQPKYFYTLFNSYNKMLNWTKRLLGLHHV